MKKLISSSFKRNLFENSVLLHWTQQRLLDLAADLQGTQQQSITWLSVVVIPIVFIANLHMGKEVEQQGSVLLVGYHSALRVTKIVLKNIIIEISSVTEN